jgi:hypothetical protein
MTKPTPPHYGPHGTFALLRQNASEEARDPSIDGLGEAVRLSKFETTYPALIGNRKQSQSLSVPAERGAGRLI